MEQIRSDHTRFFDKIAFDEHIYKVHDIAIATSSSPVHALPLDPGPSAFKEDYTTTPLSYTSQASPGRTMLANAGRFLSTPHASAPKRALSPKTPTSHGQECTPRCAHISCDPSPVGCESSDSGDDDGDDDEADTSSLLLLCVLREFEGTLSASDLEARQALGCKFLSEFLQLVRRIL